MKLMEILNESGIDVIRCELSAEKDYYNVDFYQSGDKYYENVIYLSKTSDVAPGLTVIFPKGIAPSCSGPLNFIITSTPLSECFDRLHHYFIEKNESWFLVQPFISYFLGETGNDIKRIADKAAEVLNNPIIITNSAYKVLAINDLGEYVDDPIFDDALKYGYCSAQSIQTFEYEGVTEKVLRSENAFLHSTGLARKIPRILAKVVIDGNVSAYVGVLQVRKTITLQDLNVVELLCHILRNEIERDAALLNPTNIIYESIIKDLLEDQITAPVVLKERMRASMWDPKQYFRCTLISTYNQDKKIDNIAYLINKISSSLALKVIRYKDHILVVNNYNSRKQWHDQLSFMEKEGKLLSIKIGVSNEFHDLLDLGRYYKEALRALEIAAFIKARDTVFYFAALLPFHLISCIDKKILSNCQNVYYTRLKSYDSKHHTSYVETLYYYILYNCSIHDTAKKMCVHRNTMAHRIGKIAEIGNIPMDNGIVLQNFVLFCQIQLYLKKSET